MSKRSFVLCASFGTLVLSAGSVPPSSSPSDGAPSSPSAGLLPEHTPTAPAAPDAPETPSDDAAVERLSMAYGPSSPTPRRLPPAGSRSHALLPPPVEVDEPTLWLARAIYSETKRPHEQELVAWVVRNRVDTGYRGQSTYRGVVLDPYQFSAFNPGSAKRAFLRQLHPSTPLPRWRQALWVAHYVRHASPAYRPFSIETRHFYSERSMDGRPVPYWAEGSRFVPPNQRRYTVDERRFRFFKQVS